MIVLETRDLCVTFTSRQGNLHALDHVNLRVEQGTVFGFLGPNGAGKTTAMHVLLGFISATSGEARIFGEDVRHSIARQRIGYLTENPDTYRFLSGRELLSMAGHLFGLRGSILSQRIRSVLDLTGMHADADRRMGLYSRGMMQRICLAQALINNPDLVILDEPTGGLDPIARMQVREIITSLRAQGKTVFLSSHELSEVEMVCDHLAVLAHGRVLAQGPSSTLIPSGTSLEKYFMQLVGNSRTVRSEPGGIAGGPPC